MARLLALIIVALFATSNAALPTSEQQQLVTNQGSPVHATQGWSYDDCGLLRLAPSMSLTIQPLSLRLRH